MSTTPGMSIYPQEALDAVVELHGSGITRDAAHALVDSIYDDMTPGTYEGPSPSRAQCAYFKGEYAGLTGFWAMWDHRVSTRAGRYADLFAELCDELGIPELIRPALRAEVKRERRAQRQEP